MLSLVSLWIEEGRISKADSKQVGTFDVALMEKGQHSDMPLKKHLQIGLRAQSWDRARWVNSLDLSPDSLWEIRAFCTARTPFSCSQRLMQKRIPEGRRNFEV